MKPSLPESRITDYRLGTKSSTSQRRPCSQSGTAVLVVLVIISILLIYVAGNLRTLESLGNHLKLIEKKQELRLQRPPATHSVTNAAAATR